MEMLDQPQCFCSDCVNTRQISEVSVVTATVSKENALCFCWCGAAEGIKCHPGEMG